jgi:hypothetical protein
MLAVQTTGRDRIAIGVGRSFPQGPIDADCHGAPFYGFFGWPVHGSCGVGAALQSPA